VATAIESRQGEDPLTTVVNPAEALVQLLASTNAMADRVQHPGSIPAATFGPYAYGFSYRTWRFS